jgi:hypothetical protein
MMPLSVAIMKTNCDIALKAVPTVDGDAFMEAYEAGNGTGGDEGVIAAAKVILSGSAVTTFLSLPDSFQTGGLDAALVTCSLIYKATPTGLAVFASNANATGNEALVDQLLATPLLMRDMLVAGGAMSSGREQGDAFGQKFGEAFGIYTKIVKASAVLDYAEVMSSYTNTSAAAGENTPWDDRSTANVLKRLALATSLFFAIPQPHRYCRDLPADDCNVDPVGRYMDFEHHYQNGDLDPAFPVLTAFELFHAVDSDATNDDMEWFRKSIGNFRPDTIAMSYHWRYAETVHTEVAYGDSQCPSFPGVCNGHYSDIPVGGDVCGGRAFWGRFVRKAFGLPTWGATEHAHAAMSSWTPNGWNVLLGAPWPDCWWGDRGGMDFFLETQAREVLPEFQKIMRGDWVASARGDAPIDERWTFRPGNGAGGLWSALMLYSKKIVAAGAGPFNRTIPPAVAPIVNKVDALLARWAQPPAPPTPITTAADGTITIPAASFTLKARTASAVIMRSVDEGEQLISNGCASSVGPPCFNPSTSIISYTVTANAAGTFYLTANFSTYHMNQDMYVAVNGGANKSLPMFYTVGWWNRTQPVEVTLAKGANTVAFTRTSDRDVAFKEFVLATTKPVVPPPSGNFTPVPSPPSPPASAYIEVPADTTCLQQGIQGVSEEDCGHACLALGFKDTGPRSRPNMSGCFVMSTGQYAGNCNFNTNTAATCKPPCTLYGSITRALCLRK